MSKALTTSDIHIWDYPHHNLFDNPKFRLQQFIGLAHRLVEIAEQHNCDYIILGGDIVHRPLIPSHITHVVKEFFKILSTRFDKDHILYILGQHDLATKNQIQNLEDSTIHVIADEYATYVDSKIITIDNRTIGFKNWQPDQDFSFIQDKVDLMFGHVTLSEMFGQDYDESKYSLGFFGDIHNRSNIKHSHTINVPIPHHISDEQSGSVVVIDIPTLEWQRVTTESESFKHLKMYYDDIAMEDNPYVIGVKRPTTVVSAEHIHRSIDLNEVISGVVKQSGQDVIHAELSTLVDRNNVDAINLNFTINELRINNFRSIKELVYTPDSGITSITGINGTGKSSLMRAMDFLFRPPKSARHLVNKSAKEMSVFCNLDYNGINHKIERGNIDGSGYLKYSKNDEEQKAGSMAEMHTMLVENLPFIKYFDIIYRPQGAPSLLSDYGYSQRIDLVNSLLGLSLISRYYDVANAKVKLLKNSSKTQEDDIIKQSGLVEALNADYSELLTLPVLKSSYEYATQQEIELNIIKDNLLSINKLNVNIDHCYKMMDAYNFDESILSQSVEELTDRITDLDAKRLNLVKIEDLNKSLVQWNGFRDAITYDPSLASMVTETLVENIAKGREVISNLRIDINKLEANKFEKLSAIATLKSEIIKLKDSKNSVQTTCPSCKRALDTSDYENVLKHIDEEIAKVESKFTDLNSQFNYDNYKIELDALNQNIVGAENLINSMTKNLNDIELNKKSETQYKDLTNTINKLEADLIEAKKLVVGGSTILDYESEINKLRLTIVNINSESAKRDSYVKVANELIEYKKQLESINIPNGATIESVTLMLTNFSTEKLNLMDKITRLNVLQEQQSKYNQAVLQLDNLKSLYEEIKNSIESYNSYTQLFHPTGDVIKSVYLQVASLLSDNDITVRTVKQLASGETRIDFDIDMRVEGWNIPYDDLSGGQKTRVDIYFLTRLLKMSGPLGILVLDETLKDLDTNNLEEVAKMLSDAPISSVLLSTHVDSFNHYSTRINVKLSEGYSVYTLEGK